MDALTAAKARIDRALNELEGKLQELKAKSETATLPTGGLFAADPANIEAAERIAELEAAGQDAAVALSAAAEVVRGMLEQPEAEPIKESGNVTEVESR